MFINVYKIWSYNKDFSKINSYFDIRKLNLKFHSHVDVQQSNQSDVGIDYAQIRKNFACLTVGRAKFLH